MIHGDENQRRFPALVCVGYATIYLIYFVEARNAATEMKPRRGNAT